MLVRIKAFKYTDFNNSSVTILPATLKHPYKKIVIKQNNLVLLINFQIIRSQYSLKGIKLNQYKIQTGSMLLTLLNLQNFSFLHSQYLLKGINSPVSKIATNSFPLTEAPNILIQVHLGREKKDFSFLMQQHQNLTFEIPCRILPESCKRNKKLASAWYSSRFTNTSENQIQFSHGHTSNSLQTTNCEDCSQSKISKLII